MSNDTLFAAHGTLVVGINAGFLTTPAARRWLRLLLQLRRHGHNLQAGMFSKLISATAIKRCATAQRRADMGRGKRNGPAALVIRRPEFWRPDSADGLPHREYSTR